MDSFTHAEVKRLGDIKDQWCASIFLPTHRTGPQIQQDSIRLKNLIREAERQLLAAEVAKSVIETMLEPANALLQDNHFWQHQSDGLAVFTGGDRFERYRVPLRLDQLVIVARRFQLKPLFPLLTGDGHFFILALSQNSVRLLEATSQSVDEIELDQLPASLKDALRSDDLQKQLQFHTRAAERGGQRAAVYHGQGPGQEQTKELLEKYFRQIDSAVCDYLSGHKSPLVLAGVDYYFPIYRSVSRYAQLVTDGVAGNPDKLAPEELHARAWPLVEPTFKEARQAALARFRQGVGTGNTSTNLSEILPAASQGRVDVLFVATDRQQWGTFEPERQEVLVHEASDAHNEDLFDLAAVSAYLQGGTVFAMPLAEMPDGASLAAIYRF